MESLTIQLTPSDYIQIIGIIVAIITSIFSIIISIVSLRQNSKIIKESNMAQIEIYPLRIYGDSLDRIAIKNFGNTTGYILDITLDPSDVLNDMLVNPFTYYKNMSLAPNQSFITILQNKDCYSDNKINPFNVTYKIQNIKQNKDFNISH